MDHFDVIAVGVITTLAGIGYSVLVLTGHAADAGIFRDVVFLGGGAVAALARVTMPAQAITLTHVDAPAVAPIG